MKLEPVIGLEIHVQLKTASKMFCGCSNRGEHEEPNSTVCPVCMGHPGTLPVVNEKAVEFGTLIGLALGGKIAGHSKFDRKNYFYPDLPKGYQISQFDLPIVEGGEVSVRVKEKDGSHREAHVELERLHLEEDAAKLNHAPDKTSSLVDFNRAGTPLAEIVTKPVMRSPAEAKAFLQELRLIIRYLGVSDADMEKGHLRCDANVSLREIPENPKNEDWASQLNPKTEVKNLNSFRAVERAIDYEIKRQTKAWLDGKPVDYSSTRGWDDAKGITIEQRSKEGSSDYRYFPEPDLPPLEVTELADTLSRKLPELPARRRERFQDEYALTEADAQTFVDDKEFAGYMEKVFSELQEWVSTERRSEGKEFDWDNEKAVFGKLVAGWLLTKLGGILTEHKLHIRTLKITPENFAELLSMIHLKKVTGTNALVILEEMALSGADPSIIMEEKNLGAMEDTGELLEAVQKAIDDNPKVVGDYRNGKENAIMFLVGQVMKTTRGKAPPEEVKQMLVERLKQ